MEDCNRGEGYFASQEQEFRNRVALSTRRNADCRNQRLGFDDQSSSPSKYGRLAPKKPLISKDSGRAFFDSADWALCKQGAGVYQKSTATVETLRPKLERTPHQQLPPRRPACTSGLDGHGN